MLPHFQHRTVVPHHFGRLEWCQLPVLAHACVAVAKVLPQTPEMFHQQERCVKRPVLPPAPVGRQLATLQPQARRMASELMDAQEVVVDDQEVVPHLHAGSVSASLVDARDVDQEVVVQLRSCCVH